MLTELEFRHYGGEIRSLTIVQHTHSSLFFRWGPQALHLEMRLYGTQAGWLRTHKGTLGHWRVIDLERARHVHRVLLGNTEKEKRVKRYGY